MTDPSYQPTLFDKPYGGLPPYERESATSREAAVSMAGGAATIRARVQAWIELRGARGATDWEIEDALKLKHQTASARRRELELMGVIRKTDRRRPTDTGRSAGVYVSHPLRFEAFVEVDPALGIRQHIGQEPEP